MNQSCARFAGMRIGAPSSATNVLCVLCRELEVNQLSGKAPGHGCQACDKSSLQ